MISILYKIGTENHIKPVGPDNNNVAKMLCPYELKIRAS